MKPPPFAYAAPDSVGEATALLAEYGDEARIIAGGQSLMPMLALRVARPAVLIDIGRIAELARWRQDEDTLCIGSTVRQRALLDDDGLAAAAPLFGEAARFIGHPATRSRGTIAGSLCHADPAGELPVCAKVLGAELLIGSKRGERRVAADDFFEAALSTAIQDDELVIEVRLPAPPPRTGFAFEELARRHGDFALVAVGCAVTLDDEGLMTAARIGLGGVGETPITFDLEDLSQSCETDDETFAELARDVAGRIEPGSDLHATSDYRRSIAAPLVRQALRKAADRAAGQG
ncbi:MAG TPA: xanthine dehydrogenase family protein subunit M [Alphaproteobacteria bacterium]|nr:xanthine dehydrogenase family protein subunit M [Alphaproteobacteria bacterium]